MWRFEIGESHLEGAEAAYVRELVESLWDDIEVLCNEEDGLNDNVQPEWGPAFNALPNNLRIVYLAVAGSALLVPGVPAPKLTCWTEGALAAILRHGKVQIAFEIDTEEDREPGEDLHHWRRLARAAFATRFPSRQTMLPDIESRDHKQWKRIATRYFEMFFWDDRDFDLLPEFRRLKGAAKANWLLAMNINANYFRKPTQATTARMIEARKTIRTITGRRDDELRN